MRPTQPPRLKLRAARPDKGLRAGWVIKHEEREIRTGAGEGERTKAERALAEYILKHHEPSFGDGNPAQVLIGDVLSTYVDRHGPHIKRPDGLAVEIERLAEFFGALAVSAITPELCTAYVAWR